MDAQLKEKWITALRSGEYEQTQRTLKNDGKFCCLGVLNEIRGAPQSYEKLDNILGCEWTQLTILNDDRGFTFPQIADWIQENL